MSRAMPQSDDERLAADHRSALGAKWIYLVGLPVLLVAGIIVRSPNFRMEQGPDAHPFGGDFIHEWAGAYALMHGDPGTFYDWKTFSQLQHDPLIVGQSWNHHRFFPTIYPPFYYALATPLLLFPLPVAAILATYASLAMFVISLLWFRRTEHRATNILSWALPLSLLFTPLIENFASCQKGTLLLLLLTGTYALLRGGRDFTAGLLFGLIAFKPHLGLLLGCTMLWKGKWRFVAGAITTVAVLVLACFALGSELCRGFTHIALGTSDYVTIGGYDLAKAHTLWSGWQLLLADTSPTLVKPLTLVCTLAVLLALATIFKGALKTDSQLFPFQFAAVVVAMIVTSPHLMHYDLTMLLLPMGMIACNVNASQMAPYRKHLIIATWLLYLACSVSPNIATIIHLQITVPVMLGLLSVLTVAIRKTSTVPSGRNTAMVCSIGNLPGGIS